MDGKPETWEPYDVSVTITEGAIDIGVRRLDEMESFLHEHCLAGEHTSAESLCVSHITGFQVSLSAAAFCSSTAAMSALL